MINVTKHEFSQIKRWLIIYRGIGGIERVARRSKRSVKTIVQVKNSKTYADYTEQKKAQHPPQQYSLAEDVYATHRKLFESKRSPYVKPTSARIAINEIKEEI